MLKAKYRYIIGASLLEVLISIVISAVLLIVITRIYFNLDHAWLVQQNSVEKIEKTSVAYHWLDRDITHAGYLGCIKASKRKKIIGAHYLKNSHWLELSDQELFSQYMDLQNTQLLEQINPYQIMVNGEQVKFKKNQIIFIENCEKLIISKIQKVNNRAHNTKQILSLYEPIYESITESSISNRVSVGKLISHKFFIKKTSRKKLNQQKIYSLYLKDENNRSHELIEGVSNIDFEKINKQTVQIKLFYDGETKPVIFKLEAKNSEL